MAVMKSLLPAACCAFCESIDSKAICSVKGKNRCCFVPEVIKVAEGLPP